LGMAHGIAGVMSALALTMPELGAASDCVAGLARTVLEAASRDGAGEAWAPAMQHSRERPLRSAWCYGAAGTGTALYQIARRLGDAELETRSLGAIARVAQQPSSAWLIEGQSICHGSAGVALIFASLASSGFPGFAEAVHRVVEELVEGHREANGRCLYVAPDGERFDFIDELNGTAGVALVLLTLAGEFDGSWMRLHGLAPLK
jgi:hypothetical protein